MVDNVYLGNPNLKKANTPIEFSEENIIEFLKCKDDPVYFAKKYIKIVSLDEGLVPFDLYPFQEKLVKKLSHEKDSISVKCHDKLVNQLLWYLIFYIMQSSMIVLILEFLRTKQKLQWIYLVDYRLHMKILPKWMQQGIIAWNKGSLELDNGSKILAASTSASAVRRYVFQHTIS